jgi:quinolinate synthase
VCTSSNADVALEWAFEQKPDAKVLFFPDQHLGRNTAVLKMGFSLDDCVVWDPLQPGGGLTQQELESARMILWKGHCSVHGRFTGDVIDELRAQHEDITILVHPECTHEVVLKADLVGSTEFIIKTVEAAAPGTTWAIGTELNLVQRLARAHPDKNIVFLDRNVCYCSTMNRIDLPHFVWVMESLVAGQVVNQITVDDETERHALVALQRMLDLPGKSHRD